MFNYLAQQTKDKINNRSIFFNSMRDLFVQETEQVNISMKCALTNYVKQNQIWSSWEIANVLLHCKHIPDNLKFKKTN